MPTLSAGTETHRASIPAGANTPAGSGPRARRRFGREIRHDPALSRLERLYTALLGVPIIGLRIRSRRILPVIDSLRREGFRKIGDAGCGRGLFTFYLARAFPDAEVVGMDIDGGKVARNGSIAKRAGCRNARFTVKDVTALESGSGFDFLLSMDNLEHLEDDLRQIRVFHEALAPGGRILIHVPHVTRNIFGRRLPNLMIEGHQRPGYSLPGLCGMLEEAGFAIEETRYTHGYFETLSTHLSYLITRGEEKRKPLYALFFPFLLLLSQLGRFIAPREGSALMVLARKPALR